MNPNFKKDVLPFIIATAGEFAALFFWLKYLMDDRLWLANGLLWAGFLVERVSVILWLRVIYREKERASQPANPVENTPAWKGALALFAITLSEILIWLAWYWCVGWVGHFWAGLILLVLMQAEHAVEMGGLKQSSPLKYFFNGRTFFFTLMEVLGAIGWLYFTMQGDVGLGALSLLVGLSIEHVLQGSQLRPD